VLQTIEAVIDEQGHIKWLEQVSLKGTRRVLITLLDEDESQDEMLYVAESGLKDDWLREEEDEAWEHLKKEV